MQHTRRKHINIKEKHEDNLNRGKDLQTLPYPWTWLIPGRYQGRHHKGGGTQGVHALLSPTPNNFWNK